MKVRPHPGLHSGMVSLGPEIDMSDWNEPLLDYLNSVDVVFALNTNASLEALLHGVPIVYKGNLDGLQYDLQGFVRDGIILPYAEDFQYPDSLTSFYSSESFTSKWNTAIFTTDSSAERTLIKKVGIIKS
jgi:hypothetical protein